MELLQKGRTGSALTVLKSSLIANVTSCRGVFHVSCVLNVESSDTPKVFCKLSTCGAGIKIDGSEILTSQNPLPCQKPINAVRKGSARCI